MNAELIRLVWRRANSRCEYCQLPAKFYPAPFQIDHVIARQHGGVTEEQNLALACIHCNRFKGPNVAGVDPQTREVVRLFNPRQDNWNDHFHWHHSALRGVTKYGRATIAALFINDPELLGVRKALIEEGVFG